MKYIVHGIDFESLISARNKFEQFRKNLNTEQEQSGAIRAFHYCFELSWKTMRQILVKSGKDCYYQKEIFRDAASAGLIKDPKAWFRFIALRNIAVHIYNEIKDEKVIEKFDDFSKILTELVENLKKLADAES